MAVKEGSAKINLPEGVFYNPVQEFNRDLTISVMKYYAKIHLEEFINKGLKKAGDGNMPQPATYHGLAVLEALAASGLRSVRFANEVPLLCKIVANDLDPAATKMITENASINGVSDIISPSCNDAVKLMLDSVKNRFNIVDIDPYGTASPFLDSAVQCLYDGGLLCVTSTDMAVLCGAAAGTAYGKYGGVAIKMAAQHEQGLRLLLHAIQQAASRHDKVIEPLLSLSIDFYARVFVRVRSSASGVKRIASRLALVYSCTGCHSFYLQRLGAVNETKGGPVFVPARGPPLEGSRCPHCGGAFAVAGPLWADQIHDHDFLIGLIESLRGLKKKKSSSSSSSSNRETRKEEQISGEGDTTAADAAASSLQLPSIPNWLSLAAGVQTQARAGDVVPGTLDRMLGMLTVAAEELPDCPFYFQTDKLCSTVRTTVPKIDMIRSAFLNAGYRVSYSHAALSSIKTDAPMTFIWDVICAWKRKFDSEVKPAQQQQRQQQQETRECGESDGESNKQHKKHIKKHPPSAEVLSVMEKLMARPPNPKVSFELHPEANPPSRVDGLLRYQMNPEPNWGPKARADTKKSESAPPNKKAKTHE